MRARWNAKHAARAADPATSAEPSPFLVERAPLLPSSGRALDVAGGSGRDAVWLAHRGLRTTLVDISDTACARAARRAIETGVALEVERRDLTTDGVPPGPWDLIVVHHWLDRDVWPALPHHLAIGGIWLASQPTVTNLERHVRPPRPFLLERGELAAMVDGIVADDPDLEVLELTEGWTFEGRHEARLALRRTGP